MTKERERDPQERSSGESLNFIEHKIEADRAAGKHEGRVHTRFPPEPNGYLHIGHAKAVCLNFGLAKKYGGKCNLRFDDTNPAKEDVEFEQAIQRDIRWLGCDWEDRLYYASGYFEQLYAYAEQLIRQGDAYVCDLTQEEMREHRGTLTEPGRESPYRGRSADENLDLFRRMRAGEFEDGSRTLRAKIDMASPNIVMRDPVMYRIVRYTHYRVGDEWCIYPMYDFSHCLSDSIEGITHSLCTLEFENNRPLYDWYLEKVNTPHRPEQTEFARLNLSYTVTSKRKLLQLVKEGHVRGWDDPRMPTLAAFRRRGYTPEAIRTFCERIGVSRMNSVIDLVVLENCLREDLNRRAPRYMAVLRPLKLVITNYPEGKTEELEAVNNPEDPGAGTRSVPFSRVLYIERDDFREEAPRKYFRLTPGREVRLRYAYYVTCEDFLKDPDTGEVVEVHCRYDPETRGGDSADGRKVKGTIHWVSAEHARRAEVRLYDNLFRERDPNQAEEGKDFLSNLNPHSLEVLAESLVEPAAATLEPGVSVQFERQGYFCPDPDSTATNPVFNRTVTLRDSWAKIEKKT